MTRQLLTVDEGDTSYTIDFDGFLLDLAAERTARIGQHDAEAIVFRQIAEAVKAHAMGVARAKVNAGRAKAAQRFTAVSAV